MNRLLRFDSNQGLKKDRKVGWSFFFFFRSSLFNMIYFPFFSSMVIRDLTLRSAASFGSFHLIRLLYDEYMFYLIEHRVAKAINETPIAVMGEVSGLDLLCLLI